MRFPAALVLALAVVAPVRAEQAPVIVHAGELLARPGDAPVRKQSIVITDGRISEIRDGFVSRLGDGPELAVIDLSDLFVLPGLMDMHVHLNAGPDRDGGLSVVTETDADLALTAAMNARLTVEAGFTTVLDLGTGRRAYERAIFAVRDAIARGLLPGPRILAAGSPISPTGGSRTGLFRDEVERIVGPQGVCDGAADCRRAVRQQIKRGADVINFYNTGSLLAANSPGRVFTDDEMRAIVETAHALGRKVVADGQFAEGIAAAVRAGADSIDSALMASDENLRAIQAAGIYLQSQVYGVIAAVGDTPGTLSDGIWGWLPRPILERLYAIKTRPFPIERAYRMGMRKLVFASDAGVYPHGDNAREFAEFVKRGMSEADAIRTATVNAAEMLGILSETGSLEAGKSADLIAVEGSPLDDISELQRVRFVMRGGTVYKRP